MIDFHLKKRYVVGKQIFDLDVEGSLEKGCFLGVIGPSGSGKTTMLRCLAGLTRPDGGFIARDGEFWYSGERGFHLPARKRNIGFVFQDYALFPHLTVRRNILFANPDPARVRDLLELTRMEGCADHFPRELSGGQQQRTALARALARDPDILLLDEPLSALDEDLRAELGDEIRSIQKRTGVTAIMVSHSRSEVARLCDKTFSMDSGRLVAV
jgi:molybdate transport system ATP-binding protein